MKPPEDLNSSRITNCILNAFFSCTAIILNIVTILAMTKTSSHKPLKTLLVSLAVSDLGVGLVAQPLFIAALVKAIEHTDFKIMLLAFDITAIYLGHASYFGVMAISADRFLAVCYFLRYQELVTHKRAVAAVISVWVLSVVLLIVLMWMPAKASGIILATVKFVCFSTTAFFYFKIYLVIRRHSNQIIHVLQEQNGEAIANAARQKKAAVGTFYVFLVFLACYLPNICIQVISRTTRLTTVAWHLRLYTLTLVLLNSSLNPLVYCWKMRDIRRAVMVILRNIFPCHN